MFEAESDAEQDASPAEAVGEPPRFSQNPAGGQEVQQLRNENDALSIIICLFCLLLFNNEQHIFCLW